MTDKYIAYPAIFQALHDQRNTYLVKFPDLPDTFTEGYGLNDAYLMASDVLAEMNWDKPKLPVASTPQKIDLNDDEFSAIVTANLSAKKRELQKFVRKNVTVPAELAHEAEQKGINFSATLTEALTDKLEV
jgi:predicted RNase H-like HicB family nuclease